MSEYRQVEETEQGEIVLMLYDSVLQGKVSFESFLPEYWLAFENTSILAEGRSKTYRVQHSEIDQAWVLKQYRRGGLFGKLVKRKYIFTNEDEVRSVAECRVLSHLCKHKLPVPKPIAAMYKRSGYFYEAATLTEYIPNARTLSSFLVEGEKIDWKAIAKAIYQVHHAGLIHSDLNAHNILINSSGRVFIIDLDKAGYIPGIDLGSQHRMSLLRLQRSIEKVSTGSEERKGNDWDELTLSYRGFHSSNEP